MSDCIEHVWLLQGLVVDDDGLLLQRFECERCPGVLVLGDDEEMPGSPDSPV